MTTQSTEYKCTTCGAVFVDEDTFAKHNLIHNTSKPDAAKVTNPTQDASWKSPASTTTTTTPTTPQA